MPISVRFNLSLLLLLSCQVGITQTGQFSTCDPVKDSLELVKFYNAFNGDSWNNKTNWLSPGMPIETWYGVNVHANGCVQSIYQSANNPTGEIYELDFPELEILYLSIGQISGDLPDFQLLPNLKELRISNNQLSGILPDFTSMTELEVVDLSSNNLSGTIPDFQNTPYLRQLFIGRNNLTGNLPDFSNLDSLRLVYADNNNLTGNLPTFEHVPQLEQLSLWKNALTGELPDLVCPALTFLDLGFNQYTGTIPSFENCPKLEDLILQYNQLSGEIPDFQSIPNLRQLVLVNNQFTGEIPDFSNVPKLTAFDIGRNQLSGQIPDFSNIPELNGFNASYNNLTGFLPDFNQIPKLKSFDVQSNKISGPLPDFSNLPLLEWIGLTNNELVDTIPDFSMCPGLKKVFLGNNQLSGIIPDFSQTPDIDWLYLNNNQLSGPVPDFSNLPKLYALNLSNNELTGEVTNFTNLPNLEYFYVKNNLLTGSIADFSGCTKLRSIDLANNQLNTSIPDYSLLGNLNYLSLEGNDLSSPIPTLLNTIVNVKNNMYTFDRILASGNLATTKKFDYFPQQLIYRDTTILVSAGEDVTFDLEIDTDVTTNDYLWSKDGEYLFPVPFGNDPTKNTFTIPAVSIADAGRYSARVTNSEATSLQLFSHDISLKVCDREQDSLELVKLFNSTNGSTTWDNKTNWLVAGQPISAWYGIMVNPLGCVQKIDLSANNLTGSLPTLNLNTLDTLLLDNNALVDTFPDMITPFLRTLDASHNQLSGQFPPTILDWMDLGHLDLGYNQISGSIPPDLGDLCELSTLRLGHNALQGELPEALTMLFNLKAGQVDFSDNLIDSLKQKIIWFCPFGDTILEINPSYDRFLGICNVACTGSEWQSLEDYPWIVDSLDAIACSSPDCIARTSSAGYVDIRGVKVFYIRKICYSQLTPQPEYVLDVSLYDCAGNLLDYRTCDQDNNCAEFGALTSDEFDDLKYNSLWSCGDELEVLTALEHPSDPPVFLSDRQFTIRCYPNPAKHVFQCRVDESTIFESIALINLLGVSMPIVYNQNDHQITVECPDIPSGMYFLVAERGSDRYIARVILE